jgi:penicillin-binding protein-related factor A (putative recombinase)
MYVEHSQHGDAWNILQTHQGIAEELMQRDTRDYKGIYKGYVKNFRVAKRLNMATKQSFEVKCFTEKETSRR